MSEPQPVFKPNRAMRRFRLKQAKGKLKFLCGRCKKPFVAPLSLTCMCPVARPNQLQGMRV